MKDRTIDTLLEYLKVIDDKLDLFKHKNENKSDQKPLDISGGKSEDKKKIN